MATNISQPIHAGYSPEQQSKINERWGKWLRGVNNPDKRDILAVMLENQNRYNNSGLKAISNVLTEAGTLSGDAGAFQKVILPVIRRVFPRLIAPELVGVQPMTGPAGLAVFLKYLYEGSGSEILQPEGNEDGRRVRFREYEAGPYLYIDGADTTPNYTDNTGVVTGATNSLLVNLDSLTVAPGATAFDTWQGTAQFKINLEITVNSVSYAVFTITCTNNAPYGSTVPVWSYDLTTVSGTEFTIITTGTPATGEIKITPPADYTKDNLEFTFETYAGTGDTSMQKIYKVGTVQIPGGNATTHTAIFTDAVYLKDNCPVLLSQGLENQPPAKIRVSFETHPITAEEYKLQANWSLEAQQDVNALHGEQLEDVLSNLLTQELLNETDYIVVKDLYNMAALAATWNKFPGTQGPGTGVAGSATAYPAFRGSVRDWWETLIYLMNDVSNGIHTRILRGPANFAVCDPSVSTIFESLSEFKTASVDNYDAEIGVTPVGSISNKYKIYKDPRLPKGTLLMGYKGSDMKNTGYVFAPYIPATLSPIIWDPTTFQNVRMIMTRFGRTTLLDGQHFYARVRVTENNLATSDWSIY